MKRVLLLIIITTIIAALPLNFARAQIRVPISVLGRESCGHCRDLKIFLDQYQQEEPGIEIINYDIEKDESALDLFLRFTDQFELPKATPIILVGNKILVGFDDANGIGLQIKNLVEESKGKATMTFQEFMEVADSGNYNGDMDDVTDITTQLERVKVPFFGYVNVKKYSLGFMAVILGLVDGFNPCAMWVLVMFLTILLQAGSRKRMFQLAGLFIFAETVMYYLIMTVWMTAWDFVGLDNIITPIVGLVALGAGIFFLYEYKKHRGTCKVINLNKKAKLKSKIEKLVNSPLTLVGIIGILGLAFSVNIIEFACSIGIPQAFTKILDINNLSWMARQGYILVYIIFYMIDDLIVFGAALYLFSKLDFATKYSQLSNLIGGILMVVLGLVLLFIPNLLVF